jgi:hypothetical protein
MATGWWALRARCAGLDGTANKEGAEHDAAGGPPRGELVLDLLLGALQVPDEHLNALATELLRRRGEAPVRRLLREAANPKNRPAHRVRVLQAIRHIGPIRDLASHLDLLLRRRQGGHAAGPGLQSAV